MEVQYFKVLVVVVAIFIQHAYFSVCLVLSLLLLLPLLSLLVLSLFVLGLLSRFAC